MKTYSNHDEIFIGRKQGLQILNAVKNAKKSVKIVSPYLTPSYLEELVNLRKKGVQITLITSDDVEQGRGNYSNFKHSDIIKQKKIFDQQAKDKRTRGFIISTALLIISAFFLLLSLFFLFFILALVGAGILIYSYSIKFYNYEYYSLFRLKVFDSKSGESPYSTNLVHSKIFVIDESILFLGSANFTYSGFKTHYETIIQVKDKKSIKDISEEVESLFNSKDLKAKSIKQWGKQIYEGV